MALNTPFWKEKLNGIVAICSININQNSPSFLSASALVNRRYENALRLTSAYVLSPQ